MLLGIRVHTNAVEGHVCFVRYLLASLEDLSGVLESRTVLDALLFLGRLRACSDRCEAVVYVSSQNQVPVCIVHFEVTCPR